jgi:hypothetical protein
MQDRALLRGLVPGMHNLTVRQMLGDKAAQHR